MRAKLPLLVVLGISLSGCPMQAPAPIDVDLPDTELCGAMCKHIGPEGLKCEEGEPVYDSDKPGPVGQPNTSCEEFCTTSQVRGAFMNPRCVVLAPSCDAIEPYRTKNPDTCGK